MVCAGAGAELFLNGQGGGAGYWMTAVVQCNWLICSALMGTIIMDCKMGRMQYYFFPAT